MRKFLGVVFCLALLGCDVSYYSPKVSPGPTGMGSTVNVIPMTIDTIAGANENSFVPRELPDEFFTTAGVGRVGRGVARLPDAPSAAISTENAPPELMITRLPPEEEIQSYRLGIGDVIIIKRNVVDVTTGVNSGLLDVENLSERYTVQDDGAITIPDIGRVMVVGQDLQQAEATVFKSFVEAQIDPSFAIEVLEYNSQRISVGGAVEEPVVVPISLTPLFLKDALALAGGIRADLEDYATVRIFRNGELYQVPIKSILEGNIPQIRLIDQDAVYVDTEYDLDQAQAYFSEHLALIRTRVSSRQAAISEMNSHLSWRRAELRERREIFRLREALDALDRDFAYIVGEARAPGRFAMPFGRQATLADVLFGGGRVFDNRKANPRQIYVLRDAVDTTEGYAIDAFHLNVANAANFVLATKFNMRPNDVVFVAEQPVTRWSRVVDQITPSLILYGASELKN